MDGWVEGEGWDLKDRGRRCFGALQCQMQQQAMDLDDLMKMG